MSQLITLFKLPERFLRLFKEGFWIVFGQAMAVIGSIVGVRLLTELLDPAAYGELALGVTVATLVNQIIFGPLGNGVMRFYAPAQEQGALSVYLNAVRRLMFSAAGIVMVMILLSVVGLVIAERYDWIAISVLALIFAIFSGYNSILSGIQNAARQRAIVALHQGTESWVRFLIVISLLLLLEATSTVAMLGYVVSVFLVLGSQFVFFQRTINYDAIPAKDAGQWREKVLGFSKPFATWGIFYWAQSASDRWALGLFSTTQEVGLYAVLFQLGYAPMALAAGMAMQFFTPIFYQRAGDASDSQRNANVNKASRRLAGLTLGLTGVSCLIALLFHAQIFGILVAQKYASVSYLFPWVILASGLFAGGQVIGLNLLSQMKPRIMMRMTIVTTILGVALNFAGAYIFGIQGVVIAGVAFSVLYISWMEMLSRKTISTL